MSSPLLLPQPQPVAQAATPPPKVDIKAVLESPEFNNLPPQQQRQLLGERYNPGIGQLDDNEFKSWKGQAAQRVGARIPVSSNNGEPTKFDKAVEFARPFVSDAVGAGAGALSAPLSGPASVGIGLGAKTAVDMLMQKLESNPPSSMLQNAVGADPGSLTGELANSAEMLGTNAVLGKAMSGLGRVVRDVNIPAGIKDFATDMSKNLMSRSAFTRYAGVGLPMHFLASSISPEAAHITDAGIAGIRLTTAAAKAIAKNPEAAKAMDSIMHGTPLSGGQEAAAKILTDTLNGSTLVTTGPGGDQTVILKDGKLVPLK